jgi:hypothetical protein
MYQSMMRQQLQQTFKQQQKMHEQYSLHFRYVKLDKKIFVHLTLQNNYEVEHIFMKPYYFAPAFQIYASDSDNNKVTRYFMDCIKDARRGYLRNEPYGSNTIRTSDKGGFIYKTELLYFLLDISPLRQDIDEYLHDFINVIKQIMSTTNFFLAVSSVANVSVGKKGGILMQNITDKNSEIWQCILHSSKPEFPNVIKPYQALNAVLMDEDITDILEESHSSITKIEKNKDIMQHAWRDYKVK